MIRMNFDFLNFSSGSQRTLNHYLIAFYINHNLSFRQSSFVLLHFVVRCMAVRRRQHRVRL